MNESGRRKLAGAVISDEIAHQGRTQDWAAEQMGMAPSSLHATILGEAGVTPMRLRSIAGTLGLPRRLLTSIVDGDVAQIRFIGDEEMRSTVRSFDSAARVRVPCTEVDGVAGRASFPASRDSSLCLESVA